MKSRGKNIFNTVMMNRPKKSSFNMSHDLKTTMQMGKLTPVVLMEILPGDSVSIQSENMLRLAPLISPVMHKINIDTHYFYVPNRILWKGWDDFITNESTDEAPYFVGLPKADPNDGNGFTDGCIADHLDYVPSSPDNPTQRYSPMALAAYRLIYDEFFRDQNLSPERFLPLVSGNNPDYADYAQEECLHRSWEHDYFTSCLPFAQKGDEVTLPLIQADTLIIKQLPHELPNALPNFTSIDGSPSSAIGNLQSSATAISKTNVGLPLSYDPNGTLGVDLNDEAVTINSLRTATTVQRWLEKAARGGSRIIESLLVHWGVVSSDARHQRPEYLGSNRQRMTISEVLSTAQTVDQDSNDIPVGNMAGHGISLGGGGPKRLNAKEHGFLIGIMSVRPSTSYYQGLHKQHQRFDVLDYAFPTFANLGEQEVKVKEVRNDIGTPEQLNSTFGYQMRYAEYKYMSSKVHGDMRGSLEFWHLARTFDGETLPALNDQFIKCVPDKRIFSVIDEDVDEIVAHIFHDIRLQRCLPKFGVPKL